MKPGEGERALVIATGWLRMTMPSRAARRGQIGCEEGALTDLLAIDGSEARCATVDLLGETEQAAAIVERRLR